MASSVCVVVTSLALTVKSMWEQVSTNMLDAVTLLVQTVIFITFTQAPSLQLAVAHHTA